MNLLAPVVTVFVRHAHDCPRRMEGEFYKNCKCRKHLRWTHAGKQYRLSTKSRSWTVAEQTRREIEARFASPAPAEAARAVVNADSRVTVGCAIELFLADKRAQGA